MNRRVVESFVKSGSFDSLDPRRASLFAAIDRAMEAGQKQQRDREQGQTQPVRHARGRRRRRSRASAERCPTVADWGEGERLAFEKESLGFFITRPPPGALPRRAGAVGHLHHGHGCPSGRTMPEVTVGGIITGLRLIKTKKGDRMATFVLEDLEGGVEALVFPETYKKVAGRLADDQVVLVKGKAEVLDEGRARLLVADVLPLEQAKLAEARFVTIRVAVARWDRAKGERLRDILGSHRGECPVTLELVRPGAFAVAVAPSAYFRVRPDPVLRDEVEALLGPGALVLALGGRTPRALGSRRLARRRVLPEADFEAPLVELQKRIDELAASPGDAAKEAEARKLRHELDRAPPRGLREPDALAEDAGGPPPEPALHARLRERALHGVHGGARRPALRPTIPPSCAASPSTRTGRWRSSATRRAATRSRRSTATSACRSPRATARRCA